MASRLPSSLRRVLDRGSLPTERGVATAVDMTVDVASVPLSNPIMCASGTAGHGAELGAFFDLADAGGIVVKSLSPDPWPGNPPPRVHETAAGMINSIGLQGPGVQGWIDRYLDDLVAQRAPVVASIWGRSVADYGRAAEMLAPVADRLLALEVNVSCPNVEDRDQMFAHNPASTRDAVRVSRAANLPIWAKLSPNIGDLVPIAAAAQEGGAEAITLSNTLIGMAIDISKRRPLLGNGKGGLSGPAIRPVTVRIIHDCFQSLPELPIVGVGGVAHGEDAVELMMAGASAVQVGTATFADPRSVIRIRDEVADWCAANGVARVAELTGAAHT